MDGIFPSTKREFSLLDVQGSFLGKTYKTLEEDDKRLLDNAIIHATIIKQTNPLDGGSSIYKIFERLNSSGMLLSPQEIRTAIYGSPLTELLKELNRVPSWRTLFGAINKRMRDQELILRFYALYVDGMQYKRPMKTFLNNFMDSRRNLNTSQSKQISEVFRQCVDIVDEKVGSKAFKPSGSFNAALFDSVMVGLARRFDSGAVQTGATLVNAFNELAQDQEFQQWISRSTADDDVVRGRIDRATQIFARVE